MTPELQAELEALLGDEDALAFRLDILAEDDHPALPALARWLLDRDQHRPLLWLLLDLIVHDHLPTLQTIQATLPTLPARLEPPLRQDLRHGAPEERRGAALLAGTLALAALGPDLIAALEDPYFLTRMEAATALGHLRHLPAVPALRLALRDADILTKLAALEALILIPDPDLQTAYTGQFREDPPEYTIGILDDASLQVQREAIGLLRHHRPPAAAAILEHYLHTREAFGPEEGDDPYTPEDLALQAEARVLLTTLHPKDTP